MAGAGAVYVKPVYALALVGVIVAAITAVKQRGVFVAGLLLLMLNGVPFVNVQLGANGSAGSSAISDVLYLTLVGFLTLCTLERSYNREQTRLARLAICWALVFLTWWAIKVIVGSQGEPVFSAVKAGRSFLYFGTLVPLLLCGLRRPRHLLGFLITLAAGVAIYSVGQIAATVHHPIAGLIHIDYVLENFEGLTRVYASMNDLLIAAFPMAFATLVLGPKRWRPWAASLTVLTGLANAFSFVRAAYFSEILALALISAIWVWRTGWQARRIRWLAFGVLFAVLIVVATGVGAEGAGGSSSPIQAVFSRIALGVSNLENQSGTAGVRLRATDIDLEQLGSHWVAGIGFLEAKYHYVFGLPRGTIQDNDLGSLALLVTMGVVGVVLAYAAPLAGLVYLLRRRAGFVQYGGSMYLAAALLSSVTLGALSTVSGMLVLASVLALTVNWTALETEPTKEWAGGHERVKRSSASFVPLRDAV